MKPAVLAAFALAVLAGPTAAAVDVLPAEIHFGATEARVLVRSATGAVFVNATPSVLAGGAAPGGAPDEMGPTPRAIEANATWHGIDAIVELVLRRDDAHSAVDVAIDDGAHAGVWLEWSAVSRSVPGQSVPAFALGIALAVFGSTRRAAKPFHERRDHHAR